MRSRVWLCVVACGCGGGGNGDKPVDAAIATDVAIDAPRPPANHFVYLNFDGAMLTGAAANQTDDATLDRAKVIAAGAKRTLMPWPATGDRDAITAEIRATLLPYDLDAVTTRPAAGPYHMLVFTATPANQIVAASPADTDLLMAPSCGTVPSQVAIVTGFAVTEAPPHAAASRTITALGTFTGISSSTVLDDCMCMTNAGNMCAISRACTIAGADTQRALGSYCGAVGGGMYDEHAEWLAKLGAHP